MKPLMDTLSVEAQNGSFSNDNMGDSLSGSHSVNEETKPKLNDLFLMEKFLAAVEKRAYAIAYTALSHREDALDVVQDSMLQLVRRYPNKTETEWRALFYRILHNKINDTFRKRKLTNALFPWLPRFQNDKGYENDGDPFDKLPATDGSTPDAGMEQHRQAKMLQGAIARLPGRQREAFILRCWEGFSTKEAASSMGCSEGSVKTHYSRAMESLRELLKEYEP